MARLLEELRKAGADEQVAVLLARDPTGHARLDSPSAVARLLEELRKAGGDEQVAVLAKRAAAHTPLDDAGVVEPGCWALCRRREQRIRLPPC